MLFLVGRHKDAFWLALREKPTRAPEALINARELREKGTPLGYETVQARFERAILAQSKIAHYLSDFGPPFDVIAGGLSCADFLAVLVLRIGPL